ncbi:hypothetical protein GXW82_19560 [Streptacidiphilus sp. 4-A2]|nr:hypothetical protein [Streptacidiphilus sp. 4-A2]
MDSSAPVVVGPAGGRRPALPTGDDPRPRVGRAYGLADVDEFCRRAGLEAADLDDPGMVSWTGGGPEDWSLR